MSKIAVTICWRDLLIYMILSLTDMFMKFSDVMSRDLLSDGANFQKETKCILYADKILTSRHKNSHSQLSFLLK